MTTFDFILQQSYLNIFIIKFKKWPIRLATFLILFPINVHSQDILETLDGEILQGKATINYQELNDTVIIDGVSLDAKEIMTLKTEDGRAFIPIKLTFFNKKDQKESQKVAMVSYVVNGTASLMSYEGDFFSYALINGNQVSVLQNVISNDNTYEVQNYRFVLLQSFQECVSRREIFQAEFEEKTLINLTKQFNNCKSNKFLAFKGRNGKFRYNAFSVRTGFNSFSHSLIARVPSEITGPFFTTTRVDQSREEMNFALDILYQGNIGISKVFYYHLGLAYQNFSVDVEALDNTVEVESLSATEIQYFLGATAKFLPARKISPYLSFSGYTSVINGRKDLYSSLSESYPVLQKQWTSKFSVGTVIGAGMEYRINPNMLVSINGKIVNRKKDDLYTGRLSGTRKVTWDDTVSENWILTVGYTYEIFKTVMR